MKHSIDASWKVISPEMSKYLGGPDAGGSQRATQAMLGMKKINIAGMKKSYEGA